MKDQKSVVRFLVIALSIYLIWAVIDAYWVQTNVIQINHFLRYSEAYISKLIFSLLGFDVVLYDHVGGNNALSGLFFSQQKVIGIANGCNGLVLFVIFIGFIFSYPAPIKLKLWFIPLGVMLIYLFNIIRIVSLCLIHYYYPNYLNFNHKYTFTILVYSFILLLWVWFTRMIVDTKNETSNQ